MRYMFHGRGGIQGKQQTRPIFLLGSPVTSLPPFVCNRGTYLSQDLIKVAEKHVAGDFVCLLVTCTEYKKKRSSKRDMFFIFRKLRRHWDLLASCTASGDNHHSACVFQVRPAVKVGLRNCVVRRLVICYRRLLAVSLAEDHLEERIQFTIIIHNRVPQKRASAGCTWNSGVWSFESMRLSTCCCSGFLPLEGTSCTIHIKCPKKNIATLNNQRKCLWHRC